MTFATLRALHAIIGAALDDVERVYHDAALASSSSSSPRSPLSPTSPTSYRSTPYSPYSHTGPYSPSTPSLYSPYTPYSLAPSPHPHAHGTSPTLSISASSASSYSASSSLASLALADASDPSPDIPADSFIQHVPHAQSPLVQRTEMHFPLTPLTPFSSSPMPSAHTRTPTVPDSVTSTPVRYRRRSNTFALTSASTAFRRVSTLFTGKVCASATVPSPVTPTSTPAKRLHRHVDSIASTNAGTPPSPMTFASPSPPSPRTASAQASTPVRRRSVSVSVTTPRSAMSGRVPAQVQVLQKGGSPSPIKFALNPYTPHDHAHPQVHASHSHSNSHPHAHARSQPYSHAYSQAHAGPSASYASTSSSNAHTPQQRPGPDSPRTPTSASVSASTPVRRADFNRSSPALSTPTTSSTASERDGDGGRKQRHRPTPLLPPLAPSSQTRVYGQPRGYAYTNERDVYSQQRGAYSQERSAYQLEQGAYNQEHGAYGQEHERGQPPPTPLSLFSLASPVSTSASPSASRMSFAEPGHTTGQLICASEVSLGAVGYGFERGDGNESEHVKVEGQGLGLGAAWEEPAGIAKEKGKEKREEARRADVSMMPLVLDWPSLDVPVYAETSGSSSRTGSSAGAVIGLEVGSGGGGGNGSGKAHRDHGMASAPHSLTDGCSPEVHAHAGPSRSPLDSERTRASVDAPNPGIRTSIDAANRGIDEQARAYARAQALSEALTTHPAVLAAVNRLVAACGQLCAGVQRPFLTVCDAAMGYHLPACLRLLEAAHVPEILREAGPRGMHVRDIARRIGEMRRANSEHGSEADMMRGEDQDRDGTEGGGKNTNVDQSSRSEGSEEFKLDPSLLSHVLRLLATHHITREVRPDVFANNRVSGAIDSGRGLAELERTPETKYDATNGIAAFVGLCTDELFKSAAYLTDCYLTPLGIELEGNAPQPAPKTEGRKSTEPPTVQTHVTDISKKTGMSNESSKQDQDASVQNGSDGSHADLADLALGKDSPPHVSDIAVESAFFPAIDPSTSAAPCRVRALSVAAAQVPLREPPALISGKMQALPNAMNTKTWARTRRHPMHAPFNLAFRTRAPYFEWLETEENASRLRRFGRAMTGTGAWEVPGAVVGGFPWHALPAHALVVDVGGGIGSTSLLLAHAFPHLRFLVQDRPPVVQMGETAWRDRCPELLETGRAAFQAHDFFKPQPVWPPTLQDQQDSELVGNERPNFPAVFLLRVITHDWPDEYVTRILLHLRRAAGPDTKLLLADYVLPLACVDEDPDPDSPREQCGMGEKMKAPPLPGTVRSLAPEGSPLLPNLGKANANAYWLDLTMRVTFNAQERTLRELDALTLTAGWKIVQVTRAEGTLFGHVTATPVDIPPESLTLLSTPLPGPATVYSGEGSDGDVQVEPKSPPMGDTFCSFVDLPSEDAVRKGVRASKRATQSWQARASEWRQRLLRKSSAIWRDRKTQQPDSSAPPVPSLELLPALDVGSDTSRQSTKTKNKGPNAGLSREGQQEGPKGLRRVLSRAQLSGNGAERQRDRIERVTRNA